MLNGPFELGGIGTNDYDGLLQYVELPVGWKIKGKKIPHFFTLTDEKGRGRAGMYYMSMPASTNIWITRRFNYKTTVTQKSWDEDELTNENSNENETTTVEIIDDGENTKNVIHTFTNNETKEERKIREAYKIQEQALVKAQKWLTENYPDWKNPEAYWD